MPSSSRDGSGAVQQHVMINAQEPMADDVTLQNALTDSSGITTIPLVTLDTIWAKAIELLSTSNAITSAPGSQKKSSTVLSYSQVAPHLVQAKSDVSTYVIAAVSSGFPVSCVPTL